MLARVQPEVANTKLGSSKYLEYNPQANTCNNPNKRNFNIYFYVLFTLGQEREKTSGR